MCMMPEGLEKAGLYLTVEGLSLKEDTAKEEPNTVRTEEDSKAGFKLPEEMEYILLNGVVGVSESHCIRIEGQWNTEK